MNAVLCSSPFFALGFSPPMHAFSVQVYKNLISQLLVQHFTIDLRILSQLFTHFFLLPSVSLLCLELKEIQSQTCTRDIQSFTHICQET